MHSSLIWLQHVNIHNYQHPRICWNYKPFSIFNGNQSTAIENFDISLSRHLSANTYPFNILQVPSETENHVISLNQANKHYVGSDSMVFLR